jgi:cell division septum initiation protein DivIVA
MAHDDDVTARPDRGDRIGLTGARFRHRPTAERPAPPPNRFEVVVRGYARRQVDEHVTRQDERIRQLGDALRDCEQRRAALQERAAALEAELAVAHRRARPAPEPVHHGAIGDGLLRQARREAARIRADALREATALLDEARDEAARSRESTERTVAAWTSRVEQHLAERLAEFERRAPDLAVVEPAAAPLPSADGAAREL